MDGCVQRKWLAPKAMLVVSVMFGVNSCGARQKETAAPPESEVSIQAAQGAEPNASGFEEKLTPELRSFLKSKAVRIVAQAEYDKSVFVFADGSTKVDSVDVKISDDDVNHTTELIVGYSPSDLEQLDNQFDQWGFRIIDHIPEGQFVVVAPKCGEIRAQELTSVIAGPGVRYVAVNHTAALSTDKLNIRPAPETPDVATSSTPNDPYLKELWGIQKVHAADAWNTARETNVVVAIIDTGIDLNHPDLGGQDGNLWTNEEEANGIAGKDDDGNGVIDDIHGATFIGRRRDGNPQDDNGHGTHGAGTIGAIGNNGRGVIGLNWKVRIMAVKVLTSRGKGVNTDVVKGIYYAINNGANVICNSYGGSPYDPYLREAIEAARKKGVLFVAAAGNGGINADTRHEYPASYSLSNVISVTAINEDDQLAYFSNYGVKSVDIAAPGVNILSTYPVVSGAYKYMSGTSMAAPYVAGAAALIWNHVDDAGQPRWQAVRNALISNSRHLDSLKDKIRNGTVIDLATIQSVPGSAAPIAVAPSPDRPVMSSPLPISQTKQKPVQSGGRSERFAYQQKVLNNQVLVGNGNLLFVELELKQPATVRITGHTSVRSRNGNRITVGTGCSLNENLTGDFWKESWRGLTVPGDGQTVLLGLDFITELPAGKHKVYWRVFTANDTDEVCFGEAASLIVEIDQNSGTPPTETPSAETPSAKTPSVVETPVSRSPDAEVPPGEEQNTLPPTYFPVFKLPIGRRPLEAVLPTRKPVAGIAPVKEFSPDQIPR